MEYLADKGIRHGNLKTKNILLTRTNDRDRDSLSVKVSDFGLVRTRRKSTSFASRQARKLEMARWTAPELLQVFMLEDKGETSSESDSDEDIVDSDVPEWRELGADVYSFAVTCSQILTGEDPYPYPNLNWKELGVNILRHGLTPTLPTACPSELRELLVSCWVFDGLCLPLRERPSFSHIRRSLERLQKMHFPAQDLHESLPLAVAPDFPILYSGSAFLSEVPKDVKRKAPMDIRKASMDVMKEMGISKASMDLMKQMDVMKELMGRAEPKLDIKGPMDIKELMGREEPKLDIKGPMEDMKRKKPALMDTMYSKEKVVFKRRAQMDVVTEDQPSPGKEPTDVVREIGLQEPITVEDLWGSEWLQRAAWRSLGPPDRAIFLSMYLQTLTLDVASLIMWTRTVVRRRIEWTQLREELELMLPDVLRIRNMWVGYEKTLDAEGLDDSNIRTILDGWAFQLEFAVFYTLNEVRKHQQQEDDRPLLLPSWPGTLTLFPEITASWGLSKFRYGINELANMRKKILLDLNVALRQAQRAKEQAKEHAKEQAMVEASVYELTVVIRLSSTLHISAVYLSLREALGDLWFGVGGNEMTVSTYSPRDDFGAYDVLAIVQRHDRRAVIIQKSLALRQAQRAKKQAKAETRSQ